MSNLDPSTSPSTRYLKGMKLPKNRFITILLITIIILALSFSFIVLFYLKPKHSPSVLETLEEYQATQDYQLATASPFLDLNDYGYQLECQIFLKDIVYPNDVFANFIVQAAAPCWFYNQHKQLTSVTIPIVVEDTAVQKWGRIGSIEFIPVFKSTDKNMSIESYSQFVFVNGAASQQDTVLFDSIVVMIRFAKQKPYVDYYEGMFELEGEYIPKPDNDSEFFLMELAKQQQNMLAVQQFVESGQWDQNLDKYLFYYYAERKLGQ